MKVALVNPPWSFDGSIYFGCRDPHLPLEFGYARALLRREGHDVLLVDGHLHGWSIDEVAARVAAFSPDRIVITTAPSYLFWRCAPPELRVPQAMLHAMADIPALRVVVGPHASTTPGTTLRKLSADVAVLGECEETIVALTREPRDWRDIPSIAYHDNGGLRIQGEPRAVDMTALPPLRWAEDDLRRHAHHHHRFDRAPQGPGAEVEFSRGCPYHCTFCAKDNFRDDYRKRPVGVVLEEIDSLIAHGVEYVYFIDEIFLPHRELLDALSSRRIQFGVQTRIDLWPTTMIDLLGRAGCVSIEAGVESITVEGRNLLDKGSRISTAQLTDRLVYARQRVPFVQANLIEAGTDDPRDVEEWRSLLRESGVWANKPVPMFPYPGSPGYVRRWGAPDNMAWERATEHYLADVRELSDIQDAQPRPLRELEWQTVDATR